MINDIKNDFGYLFKRQSEILLGCSLDIQICSQLHLDEFISLGLF